jgi:hypothetical protein
VGQALKLGAEGKASQLREQSLKLVKALLSCPGVLGVEEREGALRALKNLGERERLPALQALAENIVSQLEAR